MDQKIIKSVFFTSSHGKIEEKHRKNVLSTAQILTLDGVFLCKQKKPSKLIIKSERGNGGGEGERDDENRIVQAKKNHTAAALSPSEQQQPQPRFIMCTSWNWNLLATTNLNYKTTQKMFMAINAMEIQRLICYYADAGSRWESGRAFFKKCAWNLKSSQSNEATFTMLQYYLSKRLPG